MRNSIYYEGFVLEPVTKDMYPLSFDCDDSELTSRLLLNMTKHFFLKDNRTGCRLLTLDAYNKEAVISFYGDSDFKFIHEKDKNRSTRIMFYDLTKTLTE